MRHQKRPILLCLSGVCLLLFLRSSIFGYYQLDLLANATRVNVTAKLEQALERLPTCEPDDRDRQRAILYTLLAWTDFARQHNIEYWLGFGTLVGYVQRRGFIPHDEDTDIYVMAHYAPRLFELSRLNFSSKFELLVHPQWYIVEEQKRSYFRDEGVNFVAPTARFINTDERQMVDIWLIYDYHPNETRVYKDGKRTLTGYDNSYAWTTTPREWTFPLRQCSFSSIPVWCPAQPDKLVTHYFGEYSLRIPAKQCVEGTWTVSGEYRAAKALAKLKARTTTLPSTTETTSVGSNDDERIESALERLVTCTADDRSRQRTLLTMLQVWSRLAEQHKFQYWLTLRSLIGYVQHRSLSPYDSDIQIAMLLNDTRQLISISQSNFSSVYQLKVHPQWNITELAERSTFPAQGIDFAAPNARFIHPETELHIDILPAQQPSTENLTVYDSNYRWVSQPRAWTFPLQVCQFGEIQVICPIRPQSIIEMIFGARALTKPEKTCENGTWVSVEQPSDAK